jgi:hypothetical protein
MYASFNADEKLREKMAQANIQTTPLLVIKDGNLIKLEALKQYQLFYLVLDYVSNGRFCKLQSCELNRDNLGSEKRFNNYLEVMALAMR